MKSRSSWPERLFYGIILSMIVLSFLGFFSLIIWVICTPPLKTVEHDGHRWIRSTFSEGVPVVHHPDCPCHRIEKP